MFIYNELKHYGVKGQKWGVRRDRKSNRNRLNKETKRIKESSLSNREKAIALSNIGNHLESAEFYKKDFLEKESFLKTSSLSHKRFSKIGKTFLSYKAFNGEMLSGTASDISHLIDNGYQVSQFLIFSLMEDSINKYYEELLKANKE